MNLLPWIISRHVYLLVVWQLDSTSCFVCTAVSKAWLKEVLIQVLQHTVVILSF
jgi:hypothetical protein